MTSEKFRRRQKRGRGQGRRMRLSGAPPVREPRGPSWSAILAVLVFLGCIAVFAYTVAEAWQ